MNTSFAVLADIHGNSFALSAVLDELRCRNIGCIINLGDTLYGPLDIAGTYALLQEWGGKAIHVCGNGDRVLLEPAGQHGDSPAVAYSKNCLTAQIRDFLAAMSATYSDGCLFACHGSPRADTEYLLGKMHESGGGLKSVAVIAKSLAGVK